MNPFGAIQQKPEEPKCKGLIFRGFENIFTDGKGRIKSTKEVKLLKRKSCPGCEKCGWFFDFITDVIHDEPAILDNIEDQKLYSFSIETSKDWESGIL